MLLINKKINTETKLALQQLITSNFFTLWLKMLFFL